MQQPQPQPLPATKAPDSDSNGHVAKDPMPLEYRHASFNKESYWSKNYEDILLGPYDYLTQLPGKDIRTKMIRSFNTILKVDPRNLSIVSEIIAMLHTASLLVDDVEDSSVLRRGFPVAHSIFGMAQTINSSNYVYFLALQKVLSLNSPNAANIFTEELIHLHRGQGLDLYWRETLSCPSEEEYLNMVMNKTGGLYRLAVRLMQDVSPVEIDLMPLANVFGIIYQIQDDYLNLQSKNYTDNKGFCEDLTEGKFSFPIIHSIRYDTNNKQIINILKQKTEDNTLKHYAVDYMRFTTNSFEYTIAVLESYTTIAEELIKKLETDFNSKDTKEKIDVTGLYEILKLMKSIT